MYLNWDWTENMGLKATNTLMVYTLSLLHFASSVCDDDRVKLYPDGSCACTLDDCIVSEWSSWSKCSQTCGDSGVKRRNRKKEGSQSCRRYCHEDLSESISCNRYRCPSRGEWKWTLNPEAKVIVAVNINIYLQFGKRRDMANMFSFNQLKRKLRYCNLQSLFKF